MINILEIENNFCDCLIRLFIFLGHIMNIIKIAIPVIIILLGSIDLIKAMIAQNDDEIKKSKNKFIKRLIYGVVLFFVIAAVQFLIGLAGGDTNNRCFKCVADVNGEACDKENIPVCKEKQEIVETPEEPESTSEENTEKEWNCSNDIINEECEVLFSGLTGYYEDSVSYEQSRNTYPHLYDDDIINSSNNEGLNELYYNDYVYERNIAEEKYVTNRVTPGKYNNLKAISTAVIHTVDSILIEPDAKLIIYEKENHSGKILLEKEGPTIIYNGFWGKSDNGIRTFVENHHSYINRFPTYKVEVATWEFYSHEKMANDLKSDANNGQNYDVVVKNHNFGSFTVCCRYEK